MDTRYQVFVSSTFRDLTDERREVIHCLLEMNCIPAGMELFPAADETAWKLITRVIDQSDYYVLIIGGRYGSIDASGISYTEREYNYAVSVKKPVLPFLHENPGRIPSGNCEMEPTARACLEQFRKKVGDAHHFKLWNNPHDLAGKVSRSLTAIIDAHPAIGWVRGDRARRIEDVERIADLQQRLAALQQENNALQLARKNASTKRIPRIATEYAPMARLLRLYLELVPPPGDPDFLGRAFSDACNSCSTHHEHVAALVAELDRTKRSTIYHLGVEVVRALNALRLAPGPFVDPAKWKSEASSFLSQSQTLESIVENEKW